MSDYLKTKLNFLSIKRFLPKNKTLANYKPFIHTQNLIFLSGQLALTQSGIQNEGKIKKEYDLNLIKNSIEIATSNLLWNLNDCIEQIDEDINNVKCCNIKGYFNCENGFTDHPSLLNFASNMIVNVLGNNGHHSRTAIGVSSLPLNSPVEIEGIFSIS